MPEKQELKKKLNKVPDLKFGGVINKLKWLAILFLVSMMVAINVYFSSVSIAIRETGFIFLAVILLFISKTTIQGRLAWSFIKDSKNEMYRVVWSTRKETINTTMIIVTVVLIAALILWLLNSLFIYFVRTILSI